jgi:hypothetical protein
MMSDDPLEWLRGESLCAPPAGDRIAAKAALAHIAALEQRLSDATRRNEILQSQVEHWTQKALERRADYRAAIEAAALDPAD